MAGMATKFKDAASSGDTGMARVTSIGVRATTAAVCNLRLTGVTGQIVKAFDIALNGNVNIETDLRCSDGNFYWQVVSGTVVGAVGGQ